jgi:hypothetical protein
MKPFDQRGNPSDQKRISSGLCSNLSIKEETLQVCAETFRSNKKHIRSVLKTRQIYEETRLNTEETGWNRADANPTSVIRETRSNNEETRGGIMMKTAGNILWITSLLLATFAVFFAASCTTGSSGDAERIAELEERLERMEDLYKPGLHSLMNGTLHRHANLWFAGIAENWELALYQHHELEEVFADIEELHPDYKGEPVGALILNLTTPAMVEVEEAIEARDITRFRQAFNNLTTSCNNCHEATNREMIVITVPDQNTVRNLKF